MSADFHNHMSAKHNQLIGELGFSISLINSQMTCDYANLLIGFFIITIFKMVNSINLGN